MKRTPFSLKEYVRWGDVDPAGIIRYDAYTRFFELAESEFFRAQGLAYGQFIRRFEVGIPRRVMHMDFLSPPVLDEELEVRVYLTALGTTSMTMQFDFHGAGGVMRATGYLVMVCVDADAAMRKRPWPPELRALLEPWVMTPDEARGR